MGLPERPTLLKVLKHANEARRAADPAARASLVAAMILLGESPGRASLEQLEDAVDLALERPSRRLAAYGSLLPGQAHHDELADVDGRWSAGLVRGRRREADATGGGYPELVPDERGDVCRVGLLESPALPGRWAHLDAFEGDGYRRELVLVEREGGRVCVANLYVAASG